MSTRIIRPAVTRGVLRRAMTWLNVVCGSGLLLGAMTSVAQTRSPTPANSGRDPDTLRLHGTAALTQPTHLEPYLAIFGDSIHVIESTARISTLPFRPLRSSGFSDESFEALFWCRLRLANTHPNDTLRAVLYAGDPVGIRIVQPDERVQNEHQLWPFQLIWPEGDRFSVYIRLPPRTSRAYYLQTTNLISFGAFQPQLFSISKYQQFHAQRVLSQRVPFAATAMMLGICVFLGTIGVILYLQNWDIIYAWWAGYLWANTLFVYVSADLEFNLGTLPYSMQLLLEPIEHLIEFFYLLFFDAILDLRKHDWVSHRICQGLILLTGLSVFLTGISFGWEKLPMLVQSDDFSFLVLVLFGYVIIRVIRRPVLGKQKILAGSGLLTLLTGLGLYVDGEGLTDSSQFWLTPHLIFGLGVCLELVFFTLALGERALKMRGALAQVETEKTRLHEEKARQEVELLLELSKAENVALRAQMNPHFIYNSLNAIQALTNQNQSQLASTYIAKFARLLRQVLEDSSSEQISLEQELETIELYLAMEVLRFDDKLRYRIRVDQLIDTGAVQIPPLLLQPFVENAVWHGLMPKLQGGLIDIEVDTLSDQRLLITITDDGVGRARAAQFKSQVSTQYKSFGTEATTERIRLMNQLYKTHIQLTTVDLVSPGGDPLGTKVIVDIQF